MAWKNYDYKCTNTECSQKDIIIEKLVKENEKDNILCKECNQQMQRMFGIGAIKTNDNSGRLN